MHGLPILSNVLASTEVAVGVTTVATLVLNLESGARVTYSWATDVMKAWSGLEQRVALLPAPRQKYEADAYLVDANGDDRTIRTALVTAAARGRAFLLGLPFEELTLSTDTVGGLVQVYSTALVDWAQPGQRVVIIDRDGTTFDGGIIQAVDSTAITLDVSPLAHEGGRIMPAVAVYLDPQQGLARYPSLVETWSIRARAAEFGFAGVLTMGAGATLTTFDGMYVYDQGLAVDGQTADSMSSLAEIVDLGSLIAAAGNAVAADWGRTIRMESSDQGDWQWFKAFVSAIRGRQRAFLLPSWRPDLVFDSNPGSSTLKVQSSSVTGAGDYIEWFDNSLAQRRLQILKTDGSIQYVAVTSAGDNLDGTITLALDATVTGVVSMISFLETARLESDDVEVTFAGSTFSVEVQARVVQR